MTVGLALMASMVWGYSTFLAGNLSRRTAVLTFVLWSQVLGLLPMIAVVWISGDGGQPLHNLAAGLVAGVGSGTSFLCLYVSTRHAPVGIVASIAGVIGVMSPVVYAIVRGTRPPPIVLCGIAVSIVALVVVVTSSTRKSVEAVAEAMSTPAAMPVPPDAMPATSAHKTTELIGILGAVASGATICIYYVAFSYTGSGLGLVSVLDSRVASSVLTAVVCLAAGARFRLDPAVFTPAVLVGLTGVGGSVMYIFASGGRVLPTVVALVNLSPAVTVLLGWIILSERMTRLQIGGLVLAAIGVTLVVTGPLA
jgi:drug/metabolite transporter (DMT)-like permease